MLDNLDKEFVKEKVYWDESVLEEKKKPRKRAMEDEVEMIVRLREKEKMSYGEIGVIVDRGAGSVYWIYNRYKKEQAEQKEGGNRDN